MVRGNTPEDDKESYKLKLIFEIFSPIFHARVEFTVEYVDNVEIQLNTVEIVKVLVKQSTSVP